MPFTAHRAPTNERPRIARRFATLTLPLDQMHEVGRHFGATLNDVAATVVDAGLHAYLRDPSLLARHTVQAYAELKDSCSSPTRTG